MDIYTFFSQIRKGLIDLIKGELNNLNSMRVQLHGSDLLKMKGPQGPGLQSDPSIELS